MKTTITNQKMIIELERTPIGFKIKQDTKTVFILKKNTQNPELNIQQKSVEIQPSAQTINNQNSKPILSKQIINPSMKQKVSPTNIQPETTPPLKIEEPKTIDGKFRAGLSSLQPVIIPTSSIWFDFNSIHKIEQESLPEFFTNSSTKTPTNYKAIRNKILELFHNSPNKYLTGLSCIEKMV